MNSKNVNTYMAVAVLALALTAAPATKAGSCSAGPSDIVATAVEAGSFNTLVAAVKAAGLVGALQADGPLTVFAPTDEAFAKLPAGTVESLLRPENKDKLISILTYHVVPGKLTADKVVAAGRVESLNGQRPAISVDRGKVFIDNAAITATDVMASNGVIHVIDQVILPQEMRSTSNGAARDLIMMAIDRGAPMFNHGNAAACTAIYEVAAQSLLSSSEFGLDEHGRTTLKNAMDRVRGTDDSSSQAWIMRNALDEVMKSL